MCDTRLTSITSKPFVFSLLTGWLRRLYKLIAEAMQIDCGGYANWMRRLCKLIAEAMWSLSANWAVNTNNTRETLCGGSGGPLFKNVV